jgi:hypothetical protein
VNEEEWNACTEPGSMVLFLAGRARDRKLRLFACACCRRIWHVASQGSREAIEVAERFADRRAKPRELASARRAAEALYWHGDGSDLAAWAALFATDRGAGEAARCASAAVGEVMGLLAAPPGSTLYLPFSGPAECEAAVAAEWQGQVDLIRDLFGNPFRPVSPDPAWLTPVAVSLAQVAYDERQLPSGHLDPARLAVLADAMKEASCAEAAVLDHLRGSGPHLPGCYDPAGVLPRRSPKRGRHLLILLLSSDYVSDKNGWFDDSE